MTEDQMTRDTPKAKLQADKQVVLTTAQVRDTFTSGNALREFAKDQGAKVDVHKGYVTLLSM